MKRRMFSLILALILCALPAFATSGESEMPTESEGRDAAVHYIGEAHEFIFDPGSELSPTDLFPNFKDVMPGDRLTQRITVRNDSVREVKVRIYLRSLGARAGYEEFLSQLHLTVTHSAENEMAYMFDATADQPAQLSDWVCLGMLYSGGEVNLDVTLDVPVELDNRYQSAIGYLDWEFRVEEFPVEGDDPLPPQTGDEMGYFPWILLILLLLTILILTEQRRKHTRTKRS